MRPLVDPQRKVLLALTPRAGCTICTQMFFREMGILDEALRYDPWVHKYRIEVYNEKNPFIGSVLRDAEYFRMKVVRDPYRRAVSSYRFVMQRHSLLLPGDLSEEDLTFRGFLNFLETQDLASADVHYGLQKDCFERKLPDVYHRILKIESLAEDIAEVNRLLGTGYDPSGLRSPHHASYDPLIREFAADQKWSVIKDSLPDYSFFYDENTARQVRDLYRADFETYHYALEKPDAERGKSPSTGSFYPAGAVGFRGGL